MQFRCGSRSETASRRAGQAARKPVSDHGFVKGGMRRKCRETAPKSWRRPSPLGELPSLGAVARPPRNFYAGIYHLAAHGSDQRHLFVGDEDREDFLARLAANCERYELALLSYTLMGSHYHALVRIPDARLSQALQRLHGDYSRRHNRRHGRSA